MEFETDPVLGSVLTNYPSNRARLLFFDVTILIVVWMVVTVALLDVEAQTALIITVVVVGIATIAAGWYTAHLWNREVVLYERGFSYREGSHIAFLRYDEIVTIRHRAERIAYFGGLVRRTVYQTTITTAAEEHITLTNVYKRIGELGVRLEKEALPALRARLEQALANGQTTAFSDTLSMTSDGLRESGRDLAWTDIAAYKIENRQLAIWAKSAEAPWFAIPLAQVDNLILLLERLQRVSGSTRPSP